MVILARDGRLPNKIDRKQSFSKQPEFWKYIPQLQQKFLEQVAFLEIQSIVLKLIFQVLKKCIKALSIGRRNPLVQSNNFNGENNGLSSA